MLWFGVIGFISLTAMNDQQFRIFVVFPWRSYWLAMGSLEWRVFKTAMKMA